MRLFLTLIPLACLVVVPVPALSNTIIVDGGGGGHYLTIQEGVDAASSTGDVVMVLPGIYSDTHVVELFGIDRRVNVFFEKGITLMSLSGPEVTIIDGGGTTDFGIVATPYDLGIPGIDPFTPTVEGFTVRNGVAWGSVGIAAVGGEARGNIVSDYYYGLASGAWHGYTGIPGGGRSRTGASLITGNTATSNDTGVRIAADEDGFNEATVSNNTLVDNDVGVRVRGPSCLASLVGNEITRNTKGIVVEPGGSWGNGTLDITLESNGIFDNTNTNVWILRSWSVTGGYWINMTIGGDPGKANDIYGAPRSVFTYSGGADVSIDARYNYWGMTLCTEFVPQFDVDEPPDVSFSFLPFVNESHAQVFTECESTAVHQTTWGSIKAMYR